MINPLEFRDQHLTATSSRNDYVGIGVIKCNKLHELFPLVN
jgi:hypothetical protein